MDLADIAKAASAVGLAVTSPFWIGPVSVVGLVATLASCGPAEDVEGPGYDRAVEPENNYEPELKISDPNTGESRQTSPDFGDEYINTNMLPVSTQYCYEPIQIQYRLFDGDGNPTRLLAYVDKSEQEYSGEPFELESNKSKIVAEPGISSSSGDLLQLSSMYFNATGKNEGIFAFTPAFPKNRETWSIVLFFAAYDGEFTSNRALRAELHFKCEKE